MADTFRGEPSTAYLLDTHPITEFFVKNERLNFTIPYKFNDDDRECHPDFIIHLKTPKTRYVILETKGYVYEGTEEMKFTKP